MREMIEQFIEENYPRTLRYHTEDEGNIVGLPHPYSVSGLKDIFREMYYWGTYFANVGLLASGNVAQAKNNVDNLLYLADTYGFVPNCNNKNNIQKRRSQPPFLYQAVKDVYAHIKDDGWLARAYTVIAKEYAFWQTERLAPNGLNFYGNHGSVTDEEKESILRDYRYRTEGSLQPPVTFTKTAFCIHLQKAVFFIGAFRRGNKPPVLPGYDCACSGILISCLHRCFAVILFKQLAEVAVICKPRIGGSLRHGHALTDAFLGILQPFLPHIASNGHSKIGVRQPIQTVAA